MNCQLKKWIESEQAKGDEAMTTTELETGAKCLMEVKFTGKTEHGDMELVAKWVNGHEYILYASPATVHPASLLDDLRATLETERKVSHGLCAEMKVKDDAIDELRAKLAAAKAENKRNYAEINTLANERNNIHTRSLKLEQERDSARRELGEAIEWMLEDRAANPEYWGRTGVLQAHIDAGRAILARHSQPNFKIQAYDEKGNLVLPEREEQRKGEPDRRKEASEFHSDFEQRDGCDRRKPQADAVDWQAKYEELKDKTEAALEGEISFSEVLGTLHEAVGHEAWKARAEAAQAECERLKESAGKGWDEAGKCVEEIKALTTRAEQAEAKAALLADELATANACTSNEGDRRKLEPLDEHERNAIRGALKLADAVAFDWKAKFQAAQAECERLRRHNQSWEAEVKMWKERAIQAEAKLEKVREIAQTCRDLSLFGVAKPLDAILDTPPAQQASGCHDVNDIYFPEQQAKTEPWPPFGPTQWCPEVQRRIDENTAAIRALEAAQKARA